MEAACMLNCGMSHVALFQISVVLQVARCTKIINPGTDEAKYVINVKQIAKVGSGVLAAKHTLRQVC